MTRDLTVDAGFYRLASLGDRVWEDLNRNGQQDGGEPGIAGVTVTLHECGKAAAVQATTTAAGGFYTFTGLTPGVCYQVAFGLVTGYERTMADAGADATDSDAAVATGWTAGYTLNSGQYDDTVDAGLSKPVVPVPPSFTLTKTASPKIVVPYQPVTYTYVVTNTGGTTLTNIVVTDDNATPALAGDDFTVCTIASLAPGASQTCTATVIPVVSTDAIVNGTTVNAGAVIVVTPQANGDIKVTYLQDFGDQRQHLRHGRDRLGERSHVRQPDRQRQAGVPVLRQDRQGGPRLLPGHDLGDDEPGGLSPRDTPRCVPAAATARWWPDR